MSGEGEVVEGWWGKVKVSVLAAVVEGEEMKGMLGRVIVRDCWWEVCRSGIGMER